MATGGHHSISIVLVLALIGAGLASVAIPTVEAASAPAPLGIDMGNVAAIAAAGAPVKYGSYWVGQWMASSGWGGLDNALDTAVAKGVTPVVYWYYWGDSISPSCVDYGCGGKSQGQWTSMTNTLADHLRTKMGGRETLVVLENEFNKNGIDGTYAPTFDAKLVTVAQTLKGVTGVKIILGFGNWGESNWAKFPRAAAESQYIGFQMMRASTRDSEASYRGAANRTVTLTNLVASDFAKPSFLYDLAFSSYPDANWANIQAETLRSVFDSLTTSGATGLQGIVYRSLTDTYMDPANYYGLAESHWGLKNSDGSAKPAWNVWYTVATTAGGTPPPPPPPPPPTPVPPPTPAPGPFAATFSPYGGNAWWVQTRVTASSAIASVCASVNNGACQNLPLTSWGAYAASFSAPSGSTVTFKATSTDGQVVTSGGYSWPSGAPLGAAAPPPPPPPPPTPPPTPSFSATFSPYSGNEWWVQTRVTASAPIASVCASINGGACAKLPLQSWGAYAASIHAVTGARVVFTATSTTGASANSASYVWPAK